VAIILVGSCLRSVVLKVGDIAPLGAILIDKESKKQRGQNNTKGAKMLKHLSIIELTSVAYWYDLLVPCKF